MKPKFSIDPYRIAEDIKPQLPVFYNYILHNEMVDAETDRRYLRPDRSTGALEGHQQSAKPISKLIDLPLLHK